MSAGVSACFDPVSVASDHADGRGRLVDAGFRVEVELDALWS